MAEPNSHRPANPFSLLIQTTSSNFLSLLPHTTPHQPSAPNPTPPKLPSKVCFPFLFADSPAPPPAISEPRSVPPDSPAAFEGSPGGGLPSAVRISGVSPGEKGGGPAFMGQVFSMCDLSGTGIMAVSRRLNIPFLSKRAPGWVKKMLARVTRSESDGPVFSFFMDLGDAVAYVKRLNIPNGVVGACRLDLAYEHFKEKPHLFQFVPNEKQVKAANKLLKEIPQNGGMRKVDGVPVFTAQNLDIAIATSSGIKRYTPYFFDKNVLDNILEDSVDQQFDSIIQSRRTQRLKDVIDDNLNPEVFEEGDSLWEPPEVQEVMDEMGHPGIPLSVISKAAEIQLLHAVDKVILGNRWLRKATGIQPKFPYMVDSFEKRSLASSLKAIKPSNCITNSQTASENFQCLGPSALGSEDNVRDNQSQKPDFRFPFGDWFNFPWSNQQHKLEGVSASPLQEELQPNPFLPKITMVGIATGEAGPVSRATLKKTVEDLTRQLERVDQESTDGNGSHECRDPLFVANVSDYFSGMRKTGSSRWVRGRED